LAALEIETPALCVLGKCGTTKWAFPTLEEP
jgi:hypothetical protein